jgi:hypothetical protein
MRFDGGEDNAQCAQCQRVERGKAHCGSALTSAFSTNLPLIAGMRPATGIVVFVLFALCVAAVFAGKSKGGDGNSKLEKILKDGREARKNQDMQVCCWCFRDCCTFLSGFWI